MIFYFLYRTRIMRLVIVMVLQSNQHFALFIPQYDDYIKIIGNMLNVFYLYNNVCFFFK